MRQQIAVYKRTVIRPRLRRTDRLFWIGLARLWAGWKQPLVIVTPDTVLRWQRRRFREYWTRLSGRPTEGRPPINAQIKLLVTRMAAANPLWGAPRIHGELVKLGLDVSERTVSRLIPKRCPQPSQTWRTFLANHVRDLVSLDFFTVPTAGLRVLFVLVVLAHERRRIVHFNVTVVDEIEGAGCIPKLVHARKAKLMMGQINKTDKLDARGLNTLQRNGTLPTVWIPPGELRDQRELPRTRMALVRQRTQLKNRLHATLAKYALHDVEVSDLFGVRGRALLRQRCELLPPHTAYATRQLLEQVESLDRQVAGFEQRIKSVFKPTPAIQWLLTLPGVGLTLAVVIALEIGDVTRVPTAEKLASYAGCTGRVPASGDTLRDGRLRPDVNRYLKWAFIEAANAICLMRRRHPHRHVSRLYERIARRTGHPKAIGAVARPLAEAT